MAAKKFHVKGKDVTGKHRATRGRDSIIVKGHSSHHVYAYLNGKNECESLIGHGHIGLDTDYTILETAEPGNYSIGTGPPGSGSEPANGKLRVGTRGDDEDNDGDAPDDEDDEDDGDGSR